MQSKGLTLLKVTQAGFLTIFSTALLPGAGLVAPVSLLDPVTSPARVIEYLQALTLWIAGAVLIIVSVLLLISLLRFQRRRADTPAAEQELQKNGVLEMIWTVIPMAILVALIILTYQSLTGA